MKLLLACIIIAAGFIGTFYGFFSYGNAFGSRRNKDRLKESGIDFEKKQLEEWGLERDREKEDRN